MTPALDELTAPLEEVAAAIGLGAGVLKRRARKLAATHSFPLPLPGGGWRWSRLLVRAWLEANGGQIKIEAEAEDAAGADRLAEHGAARGSELDPIITMGEAAVIEAQNKFLTRRFSGA